MTKRRFGSTLALIVVVALSSSTGLAQDGTREPGAPAPREMDGSDTCAQMMQGAGITEDGKKAMREFMHSDRAPQAMAGMMQMARRMGNGDVMLGMTRMMEMMGSMGGGHGQPGHGMMHGRDGGTNDGHGTTTPAPQPGR